MLVENYKTVGIGFDEKRLKLAAIFFDQIIPVTENYNIPKNLLCELPIDRGQIEVFIKADQPKYSESDIKLFKDVLVPKYFNIKHFFIK